MAVEGVVAGQALEDIVAARPRQGVAKLRPGHVFDAHQADGRVAEAVVVDIDHAHGQRGWVALQRTGAPHPFGRLVVEVDHDPGGHALGADRIAAGAADEPVEGRIGVDQERVIAVIAVLRFRSAAIDQGVVARAAPDIVSAVAGRQVVVAVFAEQRVIARAAQQHVVLATAVERVIARAAVQPVPAGAAVEGVIARPADEDVVAAVARLPARGVDPFVAPAVVVLVVAALDPLLMIVVDRHPADGRPSVDQVIAGRRRARAGGIADRGQVRRYRTSIPRRLRQDRGQVSAQSVRVGQAHRILIGEALPNRRVGERPVSGVFGEEGQDARPCPALRHVGQPSLLFRRIGRATEVGLIAEADEVHVAQRHPAVVDPRVGQDHRRRVVQRSAVPKIAQPVADFGHGRRPADRRVVQPVDLGGEAVDVRGRARHLKHQGVGERPMADIFGEEGQRLGPGPARCHVGKPDLLLASGRRAPEAGLIAEPNEVQIAERAPAGIDPGIRQHDRRGLLYGVTQFEIVQPGSDLARARGPAESDIIEPVDLGGLAVDVLGRQGLAQLRTDSDQHRAALRDGADVLEGQSMPGQVEAA